MRGFRFIFLNDWRMEACAGDGMRGYQIGALDFAFSHARVPIREKTSGGVGVHESQ